MESVGTPALWIGFNLFVLAALAVDLGVFHRKASEIPLREAAMATGAWVALAALFAVGVFRWYGDHKGLEFVTGYCIELALSVDNLFVFYAIFAYFAVPSQYRHRVLFWGIIGAQIMRGAFILIGTAAVQRFEWVLYLFGVALIITAVRLLVMPEEGVHPEKSYVYRMFRTFIPTVPSYRGSHFVVHEHGRWYATPLLMVLVLLDWADVVFAADSIPAIFAITQDPFIVYTSNIFAILGLRAMFFLIVGLVEKMTLLKPALAAVLAFIGVKMLIHDIFPISIGVALGVIAGLIGLGAVGSLVVAKLAPRPNEAEEPARSAGAGRH